MPAVTILKNTRRQAVVKAIGPGTHWANLSAILYSNADGAVDQTLSVPDAECTINDIVFTTTGTTTIQRGGANVYVLTSGQGEVSFSQYYGFTLNESANANISINFGTSEGTVILCLTKGAGFNDPDRQNLEAYQR